MPIVGRAGKPIASDPASWANAAPAIEAAMDPNSAKDASRTANVHLCDVA
jgi:hypothetical protein